MGTTRICPSCGDKISGTLDHCPNDGTPLFSDEVMARVGMVIKDHQIQGVIGEGGMGVVYRAQHVVIEKPVAIKVLHDRFARQKQMVEQFIVEAKAASRIRHPNIIDVTDFGTTPDGLVFLVMEYLDGESLQDRLARVQRLSVFEAVNIVKQVARGLGAAHELGIVHRDLKPANIFLCEREGRRRIVRRTAGESGARFTVEPEHTFDLVKLLDFGVAKFMDLGPSAATRAGVLCGTPQYLSPEQAQEQPATPRSDIYALGAVFYETITGSVPFDGSSMFEILKGHVAGNLVPPSHRAPSAAIDDNIDAVIGCCLEKDPARRFASTDELGDALDQCVGDRAFLRDAHRLPGIQESGLDLSQAGVAARRGAAAVESEAVDVELGFSEVEGRRDAFDIPDLDLEERPDRRRRGRVSTDTTRISGPNAALRTTLAVLLLAGGVGGVAWLVHSTGGAKSDGAPVAAPAPAPPAAPPTVPAATASATGPAPSTATSGQTSPASALKPPAAAQPEPAAGLGKTAAKPAPTAERAPVSGQAAALAKAGDRAGDKSASTRARGGSAGEQRGRPVAVPMPVAIPQWPLPAAAEAPVADEAPPPPPPPAPAEPAPAPAADADALMREARQAWGRRHYAVAIDRARAVLEAAPGRPEAYQIIAVCSCAIGAAADAQEAVSHLEEQKRKLVQGLCKNHGITLD
jgi:serine/threonine protein kinase